MARVATIVLGGVAGHKFTGRSDFRIAYHAERRLANGWVEVGFFIRRKWLADRKAFERDQRLGWAYESWFEWKGVE